MKKNKDNKNYDEKINEWENHLKELKVNNEELMETYIFNTLKLNQMNQLLTDNENKISGKEKLVKEKSGDKKDKKSKDKKNKKCIIF